MNADDGRSLDFLGHCSCWPHGDPCCWCGDDTEDEEQNRPLPRCRDGVKGECQSFDVEGAELVELRAEVVRLQEELEAVRRIEAKNARSLGDEIEELRRERDQWAAIVESSLMTPEQVREWLRHAMSGGES